MELKVGEVLKKGIEAHKAGKLEEADKFYTAILQTHPKHPDANHNLGVLAVDTGKIKESLPFFKTALEANSSIGQFWVSYIDALIKLERRDDAKNVLDQVKQKGAKGEAFDQLELRISQPKVDETKSSSQIVQQSKNILDKLELDQAIKLAYKKAKENLSDEARKICEDILVKFPHNKKTKDLLKKLSSGNSTKASKNQRASAYLNMGNGQLVKGGLDTAINSYKEALKIKPDYAEAYNNIGVALAAKGDLAAAIDGYEKALRIKPDYADAYNNMGNALKDQEQLDAAIDSYKEALKIKPDYAEAYQNAMEVLEIWNKLDDLSGWIEKAQVSLEQVPPDIKYYEAKLLSRKNDRLKALEILETFEVAEISKNRRPAFLELKAKCFQKIQEFDRSYDYFKQMNDCIQKTTEFQNYDPDQYFTECTLQLTQIKSSSFTIAKPQPLSQSGTDPVFLIGFPRSGTTLLDAILRSHSRIEVIEEKPMLSMAGSLINAKLRVFNLDILETLSLEVVDEAKQVYFKELEKHIESGGFNNLIIDKFPLNILQIPLIKQLFPETKFIFSVRHPFDVILSCWMQNFKLNEAMANMVDLDRIVDLYCIALETLKSSQTRYGLEVHRIKYENLVIDLQTETTALLEFLGLDWEAQLENYRDTVLKRGRVHTPSYSQIVQPLYKDASYRWKNYKKHLEKYFDKIEPWADELGYEL